MKKYVIGGYVRDILLKRKPQDKDFVVVGSTVDEMLSLGYKQVGKDFPVFLHPKTNDEYALARKEQKIGNKHNEFSFDFSADITLYEDCLRRDFTCNAIAQDEETGEIIDYFNGQEDIKNKIIRIIDEQNFKLDPLRILRAYRFAAVLDFEIEPKTKEILRKMVAEGMLKYLSPERVWKETQKALQAKANSAKFFEGLAQIGGLHDWFSEIETLIKSPEIKKYHDSENTFKHVMCALNKVQNEDCIIKWAVLNHDNGKGSTPAEILPHHYNHDKRGIPLINQICDRLKVPNEYRDFALLFCREHMRICKFESMKISKKYDFVREISCNFHNRQRLEMFLKCFHADYYGEQKLNEFCSDVEFNHICTQIIKVYEIMEDIRLDDLPEEYQQNLKKQTGAKFGATYREYMIKYLQKNLT
mgnify:CR=1 FL=1